MWQVTQCQLPKETYSCPYPLFQRMQLKGHEVSTNRVDCHLISDLQLIGTPFQKSQTGPDKEMHGQWNKHWQDTGTGAETDMARTLVQIPTWHMIRRPVQRLTWHGDRCRDWHGKDTGSDTDMTHDTETGAETDMTRRPVQRLTWRLSERHLAVRGTDSHYPAKFFLRSQQILSKQKEKKLSAFYGTTRFSTASNLSLSLARLIQSMRPHILLL